MPFETIQVTIGAAATQVSATSIPVREVIFEAEASAAALMAIGKLGVTTSTGYNIQAKTANMPGDLHLGPYETGPIDLKDFYIAGTNGQKCNVHYVPF